MRQPIGNVESSINVALLIDNNIVGGQLGVSMARSANSIDITNKIKTDWQENLSGTKSWTITCNGLYVKDQQGLKALEDAFMTNRDVDVVIKTSYATYHGKAIITDFPLNANYSSAFKYSLTLLGNGPLE